MKSEGSVDQCDRTTRNVQLTRHGSDLLDATRRHLEEFDEAMARVGRSARGKRQVMTLGTTLMVAANILPPAIREYRRFTASTSFANPAVTVARCLTNTFAGIRPGDVPGFIAAQFVGGGAAVVLMWWLLSPLPPKGTLGEREGE